MEVRVGGQRVKLDADGRMPQLPMRLSRWSIKPYQELCEVRIYDTRDKLLAKLTQTEQLALPLFTGGVPRANDAQQLFYMDCAFVSYFAALAQTDPQRIIDMITPNPDGTFTVRLSELSTDKKEYIARDVVVTPDFHKADPSIANFAGHTSGACSSPEAMWFLIIEKASLPYTNQGSGVVGQPYFPDSTPLCVWQQPVLASQNVARAFALPGGRPVLLAGNDVSGFIRHWVSVLGTESRNGEIWVKIYNPALNHEPKIPTETGFQLEPATAADYEAVTESEAWYSPRALVATFDELIVTSAPPPLSPRDPLPAPTNVTVATGRFSGTADPNSTIEGFAMSKDEVPGDESRGYRYAPKNFAIAGPDGRFEADVGGKTGDIFRVRVRDTTGRVSDWLDVRCAAPGETDMSNAKLRGLPRAFVEDGLLVAEVSLAGTEPGTQINFTNTRTQETATIVADSNELFEKPYKTNMQVQAGDTLLVAVSDGVHNVDFAEKMSNAVTVEARA